MTVTEITEETGSRVRIRMDDEFAFVLYKGELPVYNIRKDQELEEKAFLKIMREVLPKRAKLRAMHLLKNRSYTSHQLLDKLRKGGYPDEIAREALQYVTDCGYVDDRQYALDFVEYHKKSKSRKRILSDLRQKGICANDAAKAWEETVGEDANQLEKEQILALACKKHFAAETATYEEKQKFMAFLFRKGFTIEAIRSVLSLDITTI